MVGSISVCLDGTMGRHDAAASKYAGKNPTNCVHAGMCRPWICVRYSVCSGAGADVRPELEGHACVDCCRIPVGLHTRNQQFFLRNSDCSADYAVAAHGKRYSEKIREKGTVKKIRNSLIKFADNHIMIKKNDSKPKFIELRL